MAKEKAVIEAIRTNVGCGASGASLKPHTVYAVPAEVSADDAATLIRIGKAKACEPEGKKSKGKGE